MQMWVGLSKCHIEKSIDVRFFERDVAEVLMNLVYGDERGGMAELRRMAEKWKKNKLIDKAASCEDARIFQNRFILRQTEKKKKKRTERRNKQIEASASGKYQIRCPLSELYCSRSTATVNESLADSIRRPSEPIGDEGTGNEGGKQRAKVT